MSLISGIFGAKPQAPILRPTGSGSADEAMKRQRDNARELERQRREEAASRDRAVNTGRRQLLGFSLGGGGRLLGK